MGEVRETGLQRGQREPRDHRRNRSPSPQSLGLILPTPPLLPGPGFAC